MTERDRPPVPGTMPMGAKVLVRLDGREQKGTLGGATGGSAGDRLLVTIPEGNGYRSQWVARSTVRIAPPTLWERVRPRLRKLLRGRS